MHFSAIVAEVKLAAMLELLDSYWESMLWKIC